MRAHEAFDLVFGQNSQIHSTLGYAYPRLQVDEIRYLFLKSSIERFNGLERLSGNFVLLLLHLLLDRLQDSRFVLNANL